MNYQTRLQNSFDCYTRLKWKKRRKQLQHYRSQFNMTVAREGASPSTRIKASFSQKEALRTLCSRKWMPSRWYSAQMKIALMIYPALYQKLEHFIPYDFFKHTNRKIRRNALWRRGCRKVSKIDKHMRPTVPAMAKQIKYRSVYEIERNLNETK